MTIFENIVANLKEDPYFDEFTFKKSGGAHFFQKFDGGWRKIDFDCWTRYGDLSMNPGFEVRFDIVEKWFEKFSKVSKRDLKGYYSVGFTCKMVDPKYSDYYYFYKDSDQNDKEYKKLHKNIKECATIVFNRYKSIEDIYTYQILPVINGEAQFPSFGSGTDWIFRWLSVCKIVAPEMYGIFKDMVLRYIDRWMTEVVHTEMTIGLYYDNLEEILSYMESLIYVDGKLIEPK